MPVQPKRVRWFLAVAAAALFAVPASSLAAAGDVYVADQDADLGAGDGGVLRIPAAGGDAATYSSSASFGDPTALAMLPDRRLLVADSYQLLVVDPVSHAATVVVSTLDSGTVLEGVDDVLVNFDGSVLILDNGAERVWKLNLATETLTPVVTLPGGSSPYSMVAARDGNLYFSDSATFAILKGRIGGAVTPLTGGDLPISVDIALSPDEKTIYAADLNLGVMAVNRATGAVEPLFEATSTFDFRGILARPDRNLLAGTTGFDTIQLLSPAGASLGPFSDFGPLDTPSGMLIEPAPCGGRLPTIVGSTGNDTITATPFADVIDALAGNDTVNGAAQNDLICGGAGDDLLKGGAGKDNLIGGAGKDALVGGAGRDLLQGGAGRDRLKGGKGKDRLKGGPGRDLLRGGPGRDTQKQ